MRTSGRTLTESTGTGWSVSGAPYRRQAGYPLDCQVAQLPASWEGGEWRDDLRGTPQGAIVSPILANVYLHYVLDLWFHKKWRARAARGNTIIVRYADDFVVGFQYQRDAERFLHDVKERMASFSLELHPDKTRLIEFGRFAQKNRRARGERRPETFDFLGFSVSSEGWHVQWETVPSG